MKNLILFCVICATLMSCYPEDDTFKPEKLKIQYLGDYDENGVPNYLCERSTAVDAGLLDRYFSTFVSRENLIAKKPAWFADSSVINNLKIKEATKMTITFLTEEADNNNVMGYYFYPTAEPAEYPNAINDYYVLFPNTTIEGSDVLLQGDETCEIPVAAGQTLGFFVAIQGWRDNQVQITEGLPMVFTDSPFNQLKGEGTQQKSLLLYDEQTQSYIVTFEALLNGNSDNDYDDAAVIVKFSNPNAVDPAGLPRLP